VQQEASSPSFSSCSVSCWVGGAARFRADSL
jgi:hypothetical protein